MQTVKIEKGDDYNFLFKTRLFTVIASCILSIIALNNIDLINRDGFLYIETSELFLKHGYQAAFANYNWPFFSIYSGLLSKLTGLTVIHSFYTLSVLFFALITYSYIRTCELFFDKKSLIIAAIVFLCASTINSYRDLIIRDHGYWAFTLLGVYYLIYAIHENSLGKLSLSILSIIISISFRVEGAINLITFPVIYLFLSELRGKFKIRKI